MIYTINDTRIMCETRCGHTSMLEYFGLERKHFSPGKKVWIMNSLQTGQHAHLFTSTPVKQLVIVLRNPYDRLLSAIKNTELLRDEQIKFEPISKKLRYRFTLASFCHDYTLNHSRPYLTVAVPDRWDGNPYIPTNLKHIDFHRLNEYIPVGANTVTTNSNINGNYPAWSHEKTMDAMFAHKFSDYYTNQQLLTEYERYVDLMENTEELSVEDWLKVK